MARWLFTFQVVWHLRGIEACCDQQIRVSGEVPNNSQVAAISFHPVSLSVATIPFCILSSPGTRKTD